MFKFNERTNKELNIIFKAEKRIMNKLEIFVFCIPKKNPIKIYKVNSAGIERTLIDIYLSINSLVSFETLKKF